MVSMRAWKFKNTILLIISLVVLYYIADTNVVHSLVRHIGTYGYIGAFFVGIFFVSTFTVAPAYVVLFHLAQVFDTFLIALIAGAGGVVGDLLMYTIFKKGVHKEFTPVSKKLSSTHMKKIFKTPYFAWLIPVIGALIIASPFPDEIGIGLMGLSRVTWWQFICITFVLNTIGLFVLITLVSSV